jgi:hypothetical protein
LGFVGDEVLVTLVTLVVEVGGEAGWCPLNPIPPTTTFLTMLLLLIGTKLIFVADIFSPTAEVCIFSNAPSLTLVFSEEAEFFSFSASLLEDSDLKPFTCSDDSWTFSLSDMLDSTPLVPTANTSLAGRGILMGTARPFSFRAISLSTEDFCNDKDLVTTVISCTGTDVLDDDDDDDNDVVHVVVM